MGEVETNIFQPGICPKVDSYQEELDSIKENFIILSTWLSDKIEKGSGFVRVEHNDRDGYYLMTTVKRSEIIKKGSESKSRN